MLYPIITYIQDWLLICFFIFVLPMTILLFMSKVLVETPEFLYSQKRFD